jgi:hypothetical protein
VLGAAYRPATPAQLRRVGILHGGSRVHQRVARNLLRDGTAAVRRVRHRSPVSLPVDDRPVDPARYDERLFSADLPLRLHGWFQCERYFAHVADRVERALQLPEVELTRPASGAPVVALSFRRGDYVRYKWALAWDYYEAALSAMQAAVPDATYLVFGDDREFVRLVVDRVARFGPATDAYDVATGELEQLALARACDHAVIANSTFAWWGAWLGDRRARRGAGEGASPARVVLAPQAWVDAVGPDVLPDRWTVVGGA